MELHETFFKIQSTLQSFSWCPPLTKPSQKHKVLFVILSMLIDENFPYRVGSLNSEVLSGDQMARSRMADSFDGHREQTDCEGRTIP